MQYFSVVLKEMKQCKLAVSKTVPLEEYIN